MTSIKSFRDRRQAIECGRPVTINCTKSADTTRSTRSPVSASLPPPEGTYHVLSELGRGAMALVVRAVDTRVAKADTSTQCASEMRGHVALKRIHSAEPALTQLARDEFDLLRSMQHPNIVQAYDFFVGLDERATIVLELFEGFEFGVAVQNAARGRLHENTVQTLCVPLISAVGALHQRNIIHRDVKPQNVLVSRDLSDLKLIDFSSARGVARSVPMTPAGTMLYAAPEVLAEQPSTKAGDVWGIGLCAYLALSGRLPQHRDGDTSDSRRTTAERRVSFRDMGISKPPKAFLRMCLALCPERRSTVDMLLMCEWLRPRADSAAEDSDQSATDGACMYAAKTDSSIATTYSGISCSTVGSGLAIVEETEGRALTIRGSSFCCATRSTQVGEISLGVRS